MLFPILFRTILCPRRTARLANLPAALPANLDAAKRACRIAALLMLACPRRAMYRAMAILAKLRVAKVFIS